MYWAICDIFMYDLILLELWKLFVCSILWDGVLSLSGTMYSISRCLIMISQLNLKYCIYQKEVLKYKEVLYTVTLSRAGDFQLYEMQTLKPLQGSSLMLY